MKEKFLSSTFCISNYETLISESAPNAFCNLSPLHFSFLVKPYKGRACEKVLIALQLNIDNATIETLKEQPPVCESRMVYSKKFSNFNEDVWSCPYLDEGEQKHIFIHFLRHVIWHGYSFGALKEPTKGNLEIGKVITDVSM